MSNQLCDPEGQVVTDVGSNTGQLVAFTLGNEVFGVDMSKVREIVRMPEITPVPHSPSYVAGVCNLRGNILPVIDTRTRFSMKTDNNIRDSRLLVVEIDENLTGLVVDNVREVMQLHENMIEPPPAVCGQVDRNFLEGVVKSVIDQKIVLVLNLNEVTQVQLSKAQNRDTERTTLTLQDTSHLEQIDEEQLVTFIVAKEEYAFQIDHVREIFRLQNVTEVPNVPSYVKGLFTLRNQLMPILDLRNLLGIMSMEDEILADVERLSIDIGQWDTELKHSLETRTKFTGYRTLKDSTFGKWMETFSSSNEEIQATVKRIKKDYIMLFQNTARAFQLVGDESDAAMDIYRGDISAIMGTIRKRLADLKKNITAYLKDDQRVMVVESGSETVGYLVDSVDEVVRIPKSVIETTPTMARSERREICGVAKLNNGERLIMIMDEASLFVNSGNILNMVAETHHVEDSESKHTHTLVEQALEEEQLVTFRIGNEEFGVPVMQVQEINRVTDITSVPRAPKYVDGVTNLRGSVIPVTNVRNLFGFAPKEKDDRTRIIIVDMNGAKTGLCVDQVNEVVRITRSSIQATPAILTSSGENDYMSGICKLNDGKRMIVILDLPKMLDTPEMRDISSSIAEDQNEETLGAKAKAKTPRKKAS